MLVIAWTCAGSPAVVTPFAVEPAVSPSEFVAGSSEERSEDNVEVSVESPLVSPIADAISESGDRAEFNAAVGPVVPRAEDSAPVESVVPSAEDKASLKLADPLPVVAPSDAPPESVEVAEDATALLGSVICCCIARIWSMRLVTASILIIHSDRRTRRQLEPPARRRRAK
jgi:hypothetical protein